MQQRGTREARPRSRHQRVYPSPNPPSGDQNPAESMIQGSSLAARFAARNAPTVDIVKVNSKKATITTNSLLPAPVSGFGGANPPNRERATTKAHTVHAVQPRGPTLLTPPASSTATGNLARSPSPSPRRDRPRQRLDPIPDRLPAGVIERHTAAAHLELAVLDLQRQHGLRRARRQRLEAAEVDRDLDALVEARRRAGPRRPQARRRARAS